MYALFSETLDGAVTIRAFDQQVRLRYPYVGNAYIRIAWNLWFLVCSPRLEPIVYCLFLHLKYVVMFAFKYVVLVVLV